MKEKSRLLVVDDDDFFLNIISDQLKTLNYTFDTAANGMEALNKINHQEYDILLTDINMPIMNGIQLIREVKHTHPDIISIVLSVPGEIAEVIDILYGFKAFAYLIKPIDNSSLKKTLDDAYEYVFVKQKVEDFAVAEKEFYRNIQEVFDWKREITDRRIEYITKDLIHQINIGLMHGAGFGALVGSLSLLFSKSKPHPDIAAYIVPEVIFNIIKENYQQTNDLIKGLSFAQTLIMDDKTFTETVYPEVVFDTIQKCIRDLEPMLRIKDQDVKMSSLPKLGKNIKFIFNEEKMIFSISELLINAMKYSKERDTIYILFFFRGDFLEIKFLNPAYKNSDGSFGITGKYETLVFEPFFRMVDSVDDNYSMEAVKFGLGLTLVKKIMEMHKGNVSIYSVNNNMKIESKQDVCVSLKIPVVIEE